MGSSNHRPRQLRSQQPRRTATTRWTPSSRWTSTDAHGDYNAAVADLMACVTEAERRGLAQRLTHSAAPRRAAPHIRFDAVPDRALRRKHLNCICGVRHAHGHEYRGLGDGRARRCRPGRGAGTTGRAQEVGRSHCCGCASRARCVRTAQRLRGAPARGRLSQRWVVGHPTHRALRCVLTAERVWLHGLGGPRVELDRDQAGQLAWHILRAIAIANRLAAARAGAAELAGA